MPDAIARWLDVVDERYPVADAASWDAVGLQVGDPADDVDTVLVSLDVTLAVLDEAERVGAGLVIAHHPLLFRPLARLTPDTAPGLLALEAARRGIAVAAVHTNFDAAPVGTSDPVVRILDLRAVRPLDAARPAGAARVKLVTFVPAGDTGHVLAAVAEAGAGVIGEYDHCSFRVTGTGTFRPSQAANPAVGDRGSLNEVTEDRLEVVLPGEELSKVVGALRRAHPYEEVAYDVYPLVEVDPRSAVKGIGRVGDLPLPLSLRQVADRLVTGLPAPHLRVAGDLERAVRRIAVCGGAGDSYIDQARAAGADCYVTGDLRHHAALDASTMGLALIDAGHYATEAAALGDLMEALAQGAGDHGLSARLLASQVRTEPWATYQPAANEGAS